MRVIIGCERSGVIREEFRKRGHAAYSCDLEPADDGSRYHLKGDLFSFADNWDLAIIHPPCQVLTLAGNAWLNHPLHKDRPERIKKAAAFFIRCYNFPAKRLCLENPPGLINTIFMPPTQYVQPWEFGHTERKKTGLWLRNLPPLIKKIYVKEAIDLEKIDRQWLLYKEISNKKELARVRSVTYRGIAMAMAEQWGSLESSRTPVSPPPVPGTTPGPI